MEDSSNKALWKLTDAIIESIVFITVNYILLCCAYAFRSSLFSVTIMSAELYLQSNCHNAWRNALSMLNNRILSKVIPFVAILVCIIIDCIIILEFGYLDISPTLKEIK